MSLTGDGQARNSSAEAFTQIRQGILDGEIVLGQRLIETELAERYQMSRTPVREALRRLEAEGFVTFEPSRGAQVRSYSAKDLDEIYGIRALLEGYAARLAAGRIEAVQIDSLARICEEMEAVSAASPDPDKQAVSLLVRQNNQFHRTIWEAASNARLRAHLRTVTELPLVYRTYFWHTPEERRRSLRYHRELIAALSRQDERWAEHVMQSHIYAAQNYLLDVLRRNEDSAP